TRALGAGRSLTQRQWAFVVAQLDKAPSTEPIQRLRLALPWLYALGLRRAELCAARCGDLESFEYQDADGAQAQGWLQMVRGKGGKLREVPVPPRLVQQLGQRLQDVGRETDPTHPDNRDVPIIFRRSGEDVLPIEGHRLYKDVREFFQQCAAALGSADPAGAARLRAASTHWMRHTSATHQVNGGPGQEAVPMHIVQQVLGHASPATTGLYVHAERDQRVRAMQGFWQSTPQAAR
ncbi:MAG: site-specific integrase, partial [Oxalobacteraceae bacterium]